MTIPGLYDHKKKSEMILVVYLQSWTIKMYYEKKDRQSHWKHKKQKTRNTSQ